MRALPVMLMVVMATGTTCAWAQAGANAPASTGPFGLSPHAHAGPFPPRPGNEPSIHRDSQPEPKARAPRAAANGATNARRASPGTNAAVAGTNAPVRSDANTALAADTNAATAAGTNAAATAGMNAAEARSPTPLEKAQWAEEQLDRAEAENARSAALAARGPAPVVGAFTGLTSERDR